MGIDDIPEFKPRGSQNLSAPGSQDASQPGSISGSAAGSRPPSFCIADILNEEPLQPLTRAHTAPMVLSKPPPMVSLPAPISELNADSSPKTGPIATQSATVVGSPPKGTTMPSRLANLGSSIWSNFGSQQSLDSSWESPPTQPASATFEPPKSKPVVSKRVPKGSTETRRVPATKPPKVPTCWDTAKPSVSARRDSNTGFPKVGSTQDAWSKPAGNGWSSAWG